MKYIELQSAFELEIAKLDDNLSKPQSTDTEYWLNRGLEKFYKTRYSGINYKNTGFEQNQKRIDDLRTLVNMQCYEPVKETWYLTQQNNGRLIEGCNGFITTEEIPYDKVIRSSKDKFYVRLPKDYLFLLGDSASVVPTEEPDLSCAKRDENGNIIPYVDDTIEATIETLDKQLHNTLSEHRIKYCKARPLRTMFNNFILLHTDGKYDITKYRITYLRKPIDIDIHTNPFAEYSDMPSHTHSEIVKLAAQMYLENQQSDRYAEYSNEINTME